MALRGAAADAEVRRVLEAVAARGANCREPLSADVDVRARASDESTALHLATIESRTDAMACLLDLGADIDAVDNTARTALHEAGEHGRVAAAQLLADRGADLNAGEEYNSWSPLHLAARRNIPSSNEVMRVLVEHGVSVDARSNTGVTALHLACEEGSTAAVRWLIEHGADVDARDSSGWTPLHGVSGVEPAQVLIDNGADVNARDATDHGALLYALWSFASVTPGPQPPVVRFLIKHGAGIGSPA